MPKGATDDAAEEKLRKAFCVSYWPNGESALNTMLYTRPSTRDRVTAVNWKSQLASWQHTVSWERVPAGQDLGGTGATDSQTLEIFFVLKRKKTASPSVVCPSV